ncbi:ABC-type dipeptide transport system, periplasmic component [Mycolicibacterium novocastrense]|uniref:ABC-type dipeptide transport system, periplasmic component n=1 Tax=Mycolicibacterium novocastrense TaxID=59813 RepID=A0ABQ0KEJ5_MYCNV|nr:ABC-type dipeptide transport system, periplasmic component [Mycolicibacterium novocastrense]
MTAYRFVTLTCNSCGEVFDTGQARSVREARTAACAEGWRYYQREDLCPRHFGYCFSEVAGWIYNPQISAQNAERAGYAYYPAST